MKTIRNILVLCLALALVLSLAACGGSKKSAADNKTSEELVAAAPCVLYLRADVDLTLGFNENGKALAVVGNDSVGAELANALDVKDMSAAEAVTAVITAMLEKDALISHPYLIIRQDHNSSVPNADFLTAVEEAAVAALEDMPVIMITTADMDADGYFTEEVAKEILQAHLGADAKILASSVLVDGCYIISCQVEGDTLDYNVSGYSGAIAPQDELSPDEPVDEEEMIPEDQQFDIVTDNIEDSGVDMDAEDAA